MIKHNNISIAFIITKSTIGGAQKFTLDQIRMLKTHGFRVCLITNEPGWLSSEIGDDCDKFYYIKSIEKKISINTIFRIKNFLEKESITLIVCNSANGGVYGRLAACLCGVKSIYVSHGWSAIYNGGGFSFLFKFIERFLSFFSVSTLCISNNDYDLAINSIGIPIRKCHKLSNCIYSQGINTKSVKRSDKIRFLTVCRLEHPKAPLLLVKAIMDQVDCDLFIVGNGPQFPELNDFLRINNLTSVHLLGEVENFNFFYEYDVFCLISHSEGLPISAIEALASGLPLLLSNVGGCGELIENNGILVDNNIESIKEGIKIIKKNLDNYSQESEKLFEKKFNLSNREDEYISYYLSFCKDK